MQCYILYFFCSQITFIRATLDEANRITWKPLDLVASQPLMGTISTMTNRPARTEGPSSIQRKAMDRAICSGHDHSRWMKLVTSLNLWASADIRLTISPAVDSFLESLDTTNAWEEPVIMSHHNIIHWLWYPYIINVNMTADVPSYKQQPWELCVLSYPG